MIGRMIFAGGNVRLVGWAILLLITCLGCTGRSVAPSLEYDDVRVRELRDDISKFEY